MDNPWNFYHTWRQDVWTIWGRVVDSNCSYSYTKILYAQHWKDTPEQEKNPTMTKIVNVSYYIDGHVPRTILVPCGLFLKKGGTISCVVTGPRQPPNSRDLEKLLRDQQSTVY